MAEQRMNGWLAITLDAILSDAEGQMCGLSPIDCGNIDPSSLTLIAHLSPLLVVYKVAGDGKVRHRAKFSF